MTDAGAGGTYKIGALNFASRRPEIGLQERKIEMAKTEIAKQLARERKQEFRKQTRERRSELRTPPIAKILQREELELRDQERQELIADERQLLDREDQ